jgi:ankyrin repeat protein
MHKLIKSVASGDLDSVNNLIDNEVDPSLDSNIAILTASYYGYVYIVKRLLQDPRVNPNVYIRNFPIKTPIRLALENGHTPVVKLLLSDPRVSSSEEIDIIFRLSARKGYLEIVTILLKNPRLNISSNSNQAIKWAYIYNNKNSEMIDAILQDPRFDINVGLHGTGKLYDFMKDRIEYIKCINQIKKQIQKKIINDLHIKGCPKEIAEYISSFKFTI